MKYLKSRIKLAFFHVILSFANSNLKKKIYQIFFHISIGKNPRFTRLPNFGSEPYLVKIGDNVNITQSVMFHTHDGGLFVLRSKYPNINRFGKITVGDNVFIGSWAMIMSGVTIGNNVIIGAGSIVTKDVADNCIVAGVPAKCIKSLDQYENDIFKKNDTLFIDSHVSEKNKRELILKHVNNR